MNGETQTPRFADPEIAAAVAALSAGTAKAAAQRRAASIMATLYDRLGVWAARSQPIADALAHELAAAKRGRPSPQPGRSKGRVKRGRGAYVRFRARLSNGEAWYGGTYDVAKDGKPDAEAARASIQSQINSIWTSAIVRYVVPGSAMFHHHRVLRADCPTVEAVEVVTEERPADGWADAMRLPEWFGKPVEVVFGKGPST